MSSKVSNDEHGAEAEEVSATSDEVTIMHAFETIVTKPPVYDECASTVDECAAPPISATSDEVTIMHAFETIVTKPPVYDECASAVDNECAAPPIRDVLIKRPVVEKLQCAAPTMSNQDVEIEYRMSPVVTYNCTTATTQKTPLPPQPSKRMEMDNNEGSLLEELINLALNHTSENSEILLCLQLLHKIVVDDYVNIDKKSLSLIIPSEWCKAFKIIIENAWNDDVKDELESYVSNGDVQDWKQYVRDFNGDSIPLKKRHLLTAFLSLGIITNITDLGEEFMKQCVTDGLLFTILIFILPAVSRMPYEEDKNSTARAFRTLCYSIVYNCARAPANRSVYRSRFYLTEMEFDRVLPSVKDRYGCYTTCYECGKESIRGMLSAIVDLAEKNGCEFKDKDYIQKELMRAVLSLSYLFEEEIDKELKSSSNEMILHLKNFVAAALVSPHFTHSTFSLEELLNGLEKMAVSKANQAKMIKHGVLVLMYDVLSYPDVPSAACAAALKVLWQLSFNHDTEIKEMKRLFDAIRELTKNENEEVSKNAEGVIWELEGRHKAVSSKTAPASSKKHIMVSYCWAQQKLVLKIVELLKQSKFKIWFDVKNMSGSTIDAMADAVENAELFLMCMSKNYKESPNCQSEAKYARVKKVEIVPLMLEDKWSADGWLGFILGDLLYFKFAENHLDEFPSKYEELYQEIQKKRGATIEHTQILPNKVEGKVEEGNRDYLEEFDAPQPKNIKKVRIGNPILWNEGKVADWLKENHIDNAKIDPELTLNGELLKFLHKLQDQHPKLFYKFLANDFGFKSLKNVSKFVVALEKLF